MRAYRRRTALAGAEESTRLAPAFLLRDNPGCFLGLLFPRRQSTRQARLLEPRQRRPEGNIFQFTSSTFMNSHKGPQRNLLATLQLPQ